MIKADLVFQGNFFSGRRDDTTDRVVKEQLVAGAEFMKTEVNLGTPIGADGNLARAWSTDWDQSQMQAIVFNPTEYALSVELGRKPAPVPIAPLTRWFQRKVGLGPKEAKSAAIRTSKKKAKTRTPGQFFARNAFEGSLQTLNDNFITPIGANLVQELSF